MTIPSSAQPYILGTIAVVVAWRVYLRVRRLVGRQRLRPFRAWFQVCFFPVLLLTLLAGTVAHPWRSLSELAGVAIGVLLGIQGLRRTKFEATDNGLFYTPNAHIGIALSLLFVGRLGYKLFHGYMATAGFTMQPADMVKSPLTLLIVGTLAGYYAMYAFGLLRWKQTGALPAFVAAPAAGSHGNPAGNA